MSTPPSPKQAPTIRVFFNSACPVCSAGIHYQQSKPSVANVTYEDVHLDPALLEHINTPIEIVRERLHVVDEHQQVQVGLDAFITIWRHSKGELWKAKLLSLPGVYFVASNFYKLFARLLYQWNLSKKRW
jgi:predicted DCC family thiol-disulfide oxidoreductase YuxK